MQETKTRSSFDDKVRRGIFRPVARHLVEEIREDRLQEGICLTWEMSERYARRGIELPDAILVHACRQRATDLGRSFGGAKLQQRRRDVFDFRNYKDGKVELLRLDGLPTPEDQGPLENEDPELEAGVLSATAMDPRQWIESALDLVSWLSGLPMGDVQILALRQAGSTLGEIAAVVGQTLRKVCRRLHQLGLQLCERMGVAIKRRHRRSDRMLA